MSEQAKRAPIAQLLRKERQVSFAAGEKIFEAGDPATEMYVVSEGEVEISIQGRVVDCVGPGGIFGELALIDDAPRSASAVARGDCTLARVDRRRFEYLIQVTPFFAIEVMRSMANRLRARTSDA